MSQSFIELHRQASITEIKKTKTVADALPLWIDKIDQIIGLGDIDARKVLDIGDHLRDIFFCGGANASRGDANSNSTVSRAGNAWEALVVWYLNLCLIGTRFVAIKKKKKLLPTAISDAITVQYGSFPSNSESDVIVIGYPEHPAFDELGRLAWPTSTYPAEQNDILERNLHKVFVGVIQTKTNWNENAQVPMLWDMIYRFALDRSGNAPSEITVGQNGVSIRDLKRFTYAFATAPTQKDLAKTFKTTSTTVCRVRSLSGGNYWGEQSKSGVAKSLKEYFNTNLAYGLPEPSHPHHLSEQLTKLDALYPYFGLNQNNVSQIEQPGLF